MTVPLTAYMPVKSKKIADVSRFSQCLDIINNFFSINLKKTVWEEEYLVSQCEMS